MSNDLKAFARLIVSDFTDDPRKFLRDIITPDNLWIEGEYREVGPSHKRAKMLNHESIWTIKEEVFNDDINVAIEKLLSRLDDAKEMFITQTQNKYVEWSIIGFSGSESGQVGLHIDHNVLRKMLNYGGDIDIDVYAAKGA